MGLNAWFEKSDAVLAMLLVQLFATGLQVLSRIILTQGTFIFSLMTYRHIVAAACVAPFALIHERGREMKFGLRVWFWLFMNAQAGILMAMGFFYYGMRDTSATYATNFLNLIPIVTFGFSVICRFEELKLKTLAGKIKTAGAILCVAGALVIILYRGRAFHLIHHALIHTQQRHTGASPGAAHGHWTRGTILLVCSCFSYALWFIVQVKLLKTFPFKYWATMLTCIIGSIQSAVVGICVDRSRHSWSLGWNLQLITIVYSGALATAATFCLISRAVENRGPTFPAMFNPLSLMFVSIAEALLLGEEITVGSLLGMALIILGLYAFLWGKRSQPTKHLPSSTISASGGGRIMPQAASTPTGND